VWQSRWLVALACAACGTETLSFEGPGKGATRVLAWRHETGRPYEILATAWKAPTKVTTESFPIELVELMYAEELTTLVPPGNAQRPCSLIHPLEAHRAILTSANDAPAWERIGDIGAELRDALIPDHFGRCSPRDCATFEVTRLLSEEVPSNDVSFAVRDIGERALVGWQDGRLWRIDATGRADRICGDGRDPGGLGGVTSGFRFDDDTICMGYASGAISFLRVSAQRVGFPCIAETTTITVSGNILGIEGGRLDDGSFELFVSSTSVTAGGNHRGLFARHHGDRGWQESISVDLVEPDPRSSGIARAEPGVAVASFGFSTVLAIRSEAGARLRFPSSDFERAVQGLVASGDAITAGVDRYGLYRLDPRSDSAPWTLIASGEVDDAIALVRVGPRILFSTGDAAIGQHNDGSDSLCEPATPFPLRSSGWRRPVALDDRTVLISEVDTETAERQVYLVRVKEPGE